MKQTILERARSYGKDIECERFIREWLLTAKEGQKMMVAFPGKEVTMTVSQVTPWPKS